MGATFSSSVVQDGTMMKGAEVQVSPAAPGGNETKKLRNELVGSYVVVDAAEVDAKTTWKELVGRDVIYAGHEILQDMPEVRVYFYDYYRDAPPQDFNPKRVVLFHSKNLVVTVPKLG